jgi:hypothetical protein
LLVVGRQSAEGCDEVARRQIPALVDELAGNHLGEHRPAGDRRPAAVAVKRRLGNPA